MRHITDGAEAVQAWERLFADAEATILKVELLQEYTAIDDGPSLRAWRDGDHELAKKLAREQMRPWLEQRKNVGLEVRHIRIVEEPFTSYLEWEIACVYSIFKETGTERIEIAHRSDVAAVQLPSADFWLFDRSIALQWIFGPNNLTIGALITEVPDELKWFTDIERNLSSIIDAHS